MGNVCCGDSKEKTKSSALVSDEEESAQLTKDSATWGDDGADVDDGTLLSSQGPLAPQQSQFGSDTALTSNDERSLKVMRQEQARLELIVSATGRRMVSVRSTRGSTGYYDQGFAAALTQHLEQTTEFPSELPRKLPLIRKNQQQQQQASSSSSSSSPSRSMYTTLSAPQWDSLVLGDSSNGLAYCGGKHPMTYLDHLAETYLEQSLQTKERLFAGAQPIVENLL